MKKWYFVVASIILFNPVASVIDIFPDFIAYLLLLRAFSKMSYIDAKADDVCKYLKIMALITAIKPISILLVPASDSSMYLVYSFVFAVIEIIFGYLLFTKIFEALSTYALSTDNVYCANNTKIKIFTIAAHSAKLIFAMLPDLTELSISNGVDTQVQIPLVNFKAAFFFLAILFSLAVQTVWLIFINIYTKKLFTGNLVSILNEQFLRKTENRPSLVLSRDSMFFCVTLCLASAFVIDFNLELVNVLFDSIFSMIAVALCAYMLIKRHLKNYVLLSFLAVASIAHFVIDILLTRAANKFFDRFTLIALEKYLFDSRELYLPVSIYSVISAFLLFAVVFLILTILRKHAGTMLEEYSSLLTESNHKQMILEYNKISKKNTIIALVFTLVAGVCYILYITTRYIFPAITAINSIAEVAFIAVFVKTILYYYDSVYKRIFVHS